jgi:hypothetical protein
MHYINYIYIYIYYIISYIIYILCVCVCMLCVCVCVCVSVFVCMCVCVTLVPEVTVVGTTHIYIYTYIRTYVRTYIHTYIHTYIASCRSPPAEARSPTALSRTLALCVSRSLSLSLSHTHTHTLAHRRSPPSQARPPTARASRGSHNTHPGSSAPHHREPYVVFPTCTVRVLREYGSERFVCSVEKDLWWQRMLNIVIERTHSICSEHIASIENTF